VVLLNVGGGASPGTTILVSASLAPAGGVDAFTVPTANFTQPAVNSTVTVSVTNTSWMSTGQYLYITGGGYYTVSSITNALNVVVTNIGSTGNASPSSTITAGGAIVTPAGSIGPTGATGSTGPTGPTGPGGTFTPGGDLSGTSTNQTVIKIQGRSVSSAAPSDGYVLTWVAANSDWEPKAASSSSSIGTYIEMILVGTNANTSLSTATAVGGRVINLSSFPSTSGSLNRTITFYADIQSSSSSATATVLLQNITDNETVTGSTLSTTSTAPTELSAVLTAGSSAGNLKTGKMYMAEIYITNGQISDRVTLSNARLVITYA
jgi:hypothetical protein